MRKHRHKKFTEILLTKNTVYVTIIAVSYTHLDVYKRQAEGYGLAGAKVMLTGRSEKKLEPLRKELAEKGIECAYAAGDPAVEEDVVRVVEETVREFGGIDILVTAAGMNAPKPILSLSLIHI